MTFWSWRQMPLALKLTLTITSIVVLVVLVITLLTIRRERATFQAELEQQAVLVLDTISASVADSLYFLDADFLSDTMLDLGMNEVVIFGRIYDDDGRIVADALDENTRFNREPDSLGQRLLEAESPVFDWQPERLVAGQAVIVGTQRLGAISVGLPTAPLDAKLAAVRTQGLIVAAVTVLMGLVLALLFSRSITGPVQDMIAATQGISQGDLTQRVHTSSGDELATLGNHFNQMAAQLEQTLQQMEQQIAELDAFSHTVAHDLKGPLTFISGISELIVAKHDEIDDAQKLDYLLKVHQSGRKAANIIDELLLLATVRQQDVEVRPLEMRFVVAQALEQLAFMAAEKDAEIILPESWSTALGYAPWVEEVWVNYLSNGLKYGGEPPRLELGSGNTENGMVRFWVRDNGPGIPDEQQTMLFTEFVRLSKVRAQGHGLGLSIVQRIIHKLDGSVGLESEQGKGTLFYFELPRAAPHA